MNQMKLPFKKSPTIRFEWANWWNLSLYKGTGWDKDFKDIKWYLWSIFHIIIENRYSIQL